MAITIEHVYSTHAEITYYLDEDFNEQFPHGLTQVLCGTMDDIAEYVSKILVKHNFSSADVCDASTGEVLMVISRDNERSI